MKPYRCILFDLDGTLTDPAEGIFKCFRLGLSQFGLSEPDDAKLHAVIGPPLFDSYTELYGLSPEQAHAAIAAYRAEYEHDGCYLNRIYDGVPALLARLKGSGLRLLTATSKPEKPTLMILQHFGLLPYFDFVAAASRDLSRSSKESVIEYALQNLGGIPTDALLMVGDRHYDLNGAAYHKIDGAGVTYGYGTRAELSACPHVFLADTPAALGNFILKE